jgi:hypothetical protein
VARAKERHAELEAKLEQALDNEAAAEMVGLQQEMVADHGKQAAALGQDLLQALKNTRCLSLRRTLSLPLPLPLPPSLPLPQKFLKQHPNASRQRLNQRRGGAEAAARRARGQAGGAAAAAGGR